jgi:hypothetical protein
MKGISAFCKKVDEAESTLSLRTDLNAKYKVKYFSISHVIGNK